MSRKRRLRIIVVAGAAVLWTAVGILALELMETVRLTRASNTAAAINESMVHGIPMMRMVTEEAPALPSPTPAPPEVIARLATIPRSPEGRISALADWAPQASAWDRFRIAMAELDDHERNIRATLTGEFFATFTDRGQPLETFGDPRFARELIRGTRNGMAWQSLDHLIPDGDWPAPGETARSVMTLQSHFGFVFEVDLHRADDGQILLHARNILQDQPWNAVAEAGGAAPSNHLHVPGLRYYPNYDRPPVFTDPLGFKSSPVTIPKPQGVFRVVCFGGSTVEEADVGMGRTTDYLEQRFDAAFGAGVVEVINAGQASMDTYGMRLRVNDYFAYEPNLLVYYGGVNDLVSHRRYWEQMTGNSRRALRLSRFLNHRFNRQRLPGDPTITAFMQSTTLHNLQAIRWAAEAHGIQFALCSFAYPRPQHLTRDEAAFLEFNAKTTWLGEDLNFHTMTRLLDLHNAMLHDWARREALLLIPVYESLDVGMEFFRDACHFERNGSELRAEILFQHLTPLVEAWRAAES